MILMGTQIITTRPECDSVDRISGIFIIIDNTSGANLWSNHTKPKRLYASNSVIGYKYNRLALLELGKLYSSSDFNLDKNELLSNLDSHSDNQKYYIYYYERDLIYSYEYLFKIFPYPLQDHLTKEEPKLKFLKYEIIEKNTIYNHDDLINHTDYESDYSEVSCDSDSVIL